MDANDIGYFDEKLTRKNQNVRTMQTGVRLSETTITIGSFQTIMISEDENGNLMLSRGIHIQTELELHWEDITRINEKQESELIFHSRKCNR